MNAKEVINKITTGVDLCKKWGRALIGVARVEYILKRAEEDYERCVGQQVSFVEKTDPVVIDLQKAVGRGETGNVRKIRGKLGEDTPVAQSEAVVRVYYEGLEDNRRKRLVTINYLWGETRDFLGLHVDKGRQKRMEQEMEGWFKK